MMVKSIICILQCFLIISSIVLVALPISSLADDAAAGADSAATAGRKEGPAGADAPAGGADAPAAGGADAPAAGGADASGGGGKVPDTVTSAFPGMIPVKDAAGNDPVPADPAEVEGWFNKAITPLADRKDKIDPNLVTAEATPKTIKVRQDGSGEFKTVTDALSSVPDENTVRTIIEIGPGEYKEKIKVEKNKPYITFLGSDPKDMPVLTFDGTAAKFGTDDSASVIIESDYFYAQHIVFRNTAARPTGKTIGEQAVAVRISGDKGAFYNCRLIAFQDTLCDDKGKHFFKDCYIEGTVDFIFGDGDSIYVNCDIHVIPGDNMAIITAQAGQNPDDPGTYIFMHGSVTGSGKFAYLGRAWMPAPTVVYCYTTLSDAVIPVGWWDNKKPNLDKSVQFGEYKTKGPGADPAERAKYGKELTDDEVTEFLSLEYIEASKWLLPPPAGADPKIPDGPANPPGPTPGTAKS